MRVLVAPQELKESLTATEAAAAIARGIASAHPDWELDLLPMSDGGPGFLDALAGATPADSHPVPVHDALGRPVTARFLSLPETGTAAVESALANGLALIRPAERDPLRASTEGVGELVAAALATRPSRLVVGVGGSATSDGGSGMARALGARLLDASGEELPPGGGPLARLDRIEWDRPGALAEVEVVVASDVTNPLTGPLGAAAVFGPQKGASAAQVRELDAALARFADIVERDLGVAVDDLPGAGAAGGLGAGLVAFLGARIASGFDLVAEATGLHARLEAADVAVTGEGSYDEQSAHGKTTGRLRALAREAGKVCVVFAGRSDVREADVYSLESLEADPVRSMANAGPLLERLTGGWAASLIVG